MATVPGVVTIWAWDNVNNVCDELLQQARSEEGDKDHD